MPDQDDKKKLYYEVVEKKGIVYDKVKAEWLAEINMYEMTHDVEHRTPSIFYADGSYVFVMTFCCETKEGAIY